MYLIECSTHFAHKPFSSFFFIHIPFPSYCRCRSCVVLFHGRLPLGGTEGKVSRNLPFGISHLLLHYYHRSFPFAVFVFIWLCFPCLLILLYLSSRCLVLVRIIYCLYIYISTMHTFIHIPLVSFSLCLFAYCL
uniref:Uncharacterized protein n=1 Tax=Trypanosoma congolense (strain IL3000) TaxID=1068625 RepID=F9WEX0_TRYCI|nr:hypothetical protein, unlikely [Trypanosoma congolense IL3000]